MAQSGFVFRKGNAWILKYRDNFQEDGAVVRKQVCVKVADFCDSYRCASDLDDIVAEKLAGVRQAGKCARSTDTFTYYVENVYLPMVQRTKKPSTYSGYKTYFHRYIKPHVENYVLRDFNVALVSSLLEKIADAVRNSKEPQRVAGPRGINKDTAMKIRSIVSAIFTYAMGKGHFPGGNNPASKALIPEKHFFAPKKKTRAASLSEVNTILAHLKEQGLLLERAAVALIALTGVRPGEARGLRWEEWDRTQKQIQVARAVWRSIEGTTKTEESERYVRVSPNLHKILNELWQNQTCPISGYILARPDGRRFDLDNISKRRIIPAFNRCAICHEPKDGHEGHEYRRDENLPQWYGWYSLRRFHGTKVRQSAGNNETASKALGNSKEVFSRHYDKPTEVRSDVSRAVDESMSGIAV